MRVGVPEAVAMRPACPLLSRFAPRTGLVTPRQTFCSSPPWRLAVRSTPSKALAGGLSGPGGRLADHSSTGGAPAGTASGSAGPVGRP